MGKTIRNPKKSSVRNKSVRNYRSENRTKCGRLLAWGEEFQRGRSYKKQDFSWIDKPHGREFRPKGIMSSHYTPATTRRLLRCDRQWQKRMESDSTTWD